MREDMMGKLARSRAYRVHQSGSGRFEIANVKKRVARRRESEALTSEDVCVFDVGWRIVHVLLRHRMTIICENWVCMMLLHL
jgi:hypothetical protein